MHKEAAPILQALYGESALRRNLLGKSLLDLAALTKHGTIGLDTYHGFQTVFRGALGFQTFGFKQGLAPHEYADADLDRAVKAGKIAQAAADYARQSRPILDKMVAEGLNVGKVADNLLEAARQHNLIESIPVLGHVAAKTN